jgi:hypothetical protein
MTSAPKAGPRAMLGKLVSALLKLLLHLRELYLASQRRAHQLPQALAAGRKSSAPPGAESE